ncbi:epidermal growth factor receptor kinase substrate 8-like protein 1 [Ambystoma mexicanum]|uniref:epidermal growth factor receptor kinase substrate 8-like protein 1 n=1 Tax=Ambystoma mexicanum TaxID=8296 RepID=UPI0037E7DF9F
MADTQYHVNHMVTITIGKDNDVHTVEDAIHKLSVMDTKGKIWVQEMLLQLNISSVKLLDVESQDELEDYSLGAIERCETVLPAGQARSLLIFVCLVCQDYYQQQHDVHFFQCDQVGAELIMEDINSAMMDLKSGKNLKIAEALRVNQEIMSPARMSANIAPGAFSYSPFTQQRQMPSEPVEPSDVLQRGASCYTPIQVATIVGGRPQIVLANKDIYSLPKKTQTMGQLVQGSQESLSSPKPEAMQAGPAQQGEQMGQVAPTEQLNGLSMVDGAAQIDYATLPNEQEVDLLIHNFDDSESFLGKLQKSAKAFKVLDQRKKTRRNKKTASGGCHVIYNALPGSTSSEDCGRVFLPLSLACLETRSDNAAPGQPGNETYI